MSTTENEGSKKSSRGPVKIKLTVFTFGSQKKGGRKQGNSKTVSPDLDLHHGDSIHREDKD